MRQHWTSVYAGSALPVLGLFAGVAAVLVATACVSFAQVSLSYWISMRGVASETQPTFVSLSPVATATHSVAFAGCHGRIWYLQPTSASSVQMARAAGETVQIHRGPAGTTPSGSTVICLIQADG